MPLLSGFGTVDVEALGAPGIIDEEEAFVPPVDGADDAEPASAGGAVDDDAPELVEADVEGDALPGAIVDELDDGEVLSLEVVGFDAADEELDVEDDGDGVTTGGVVVDAGGVDSRLQPATPTARPVQSSVIKAVFIVISIGNSGKGD